MLSFIPRKIANGVYEIASFDNTSEPGGVYRVKITNQSISCNCPGFWRQKDKTQHKHTKIVKFWLDHLYGVPGYAFWLDAHEDVECRQLFTDEFAEAWKNH